MKLTMLQQPYRDGGINHVNLALRMNANWAQFIPRMLKKDAPTWCNFWWYGLRRSYAGLEHQGSLRHLMLSSCGFAKLQEDGGVSEVQKAVFAA